MPRTSDPPRQTAVGRLFDPLPHAAPLAQWRMLESAFATLAVPPPAAYAPLAGGLALFATTGQAWCLAWALAVLTGMAVCRRVAAAFDMRTAESTARTWAARHAACVWLQAALLGAGGAGAVATGNADAAMLMALPLAFSASRHGAGAVLPGPARLQALLLLGPLAAASLVVGTPPFLALAALAAVLAAMAAALADTGAESVRAAAEAQAALQQEPVKEHVPLSPAAADFQKLMGRDQATGLPNKHSFMHLLGQETARAYRAETALSLLLVACDDFEDAAATMPREALDARMSSIARRLRGRLQRQQDIITSLGGGRFGVILPFTDAFGAKTVAENLQAALRTPTLEADGSDASAAISIGAATYCGKGLLPEAQLLHYAEEALSAARKTGGDRITRYDPMIDTLRPPTHKQAAVTLESS